MTVYNVPQGSEAWEKLRFGRPTASQFSRIGWNRKKDGLGQGAMTYLYELLAQRAGVWTQPPPSFWMELGTEMESEAVEDYELRHGVTCSTVGFVTALNDRIGCSPDRTVGDRGLIEVKCPAPQTHFKWLIEGVLPDDHEDQVRGEMFICGVDWVDFYSYHPGLKPFRYRVLNDADQAKWVGNFCKLIDLFSVELERTWGIVK